MPLIQSLKNRFFCTASHVPSRESHSSKPPSSSSGPQTLSALLSSTVQCYGDRTAFRSIQPQEKTPSSTRLRDKKFSIIPYTWNAYSEAAKTFAKALIAQGVQPRDVVTIQGSNSPQWLFANLGTILAGGVSAGVYPTNGKELCENVVKTNGAKVVVVEDEEQLKKYVTVSSSALKCIVVWNKIKNPSHSFPVPVLQWDEFLRTGATVSDDALDTRIKAQNPRDPCTLIYTSGTTGNPKAVTLSHENLAWTALSAGKHFSIDPDHRSLSFLPLSHIAPLLLDCICPLIFGHSVDIAPSDVLQGMNLRQHLITTRPTYFLAVPRVWEKFKEGIETRVKTASFLKRKAFQVSSRIAKALAPDCNYLTEKKRTSRLRVQEKIRYVFERIILSLFEKILFTPIKRAIGLDRCKIAASGAGALDQKVRTFFHGLNLHVLDLYGMSESSGPITLSTKGSPPGSCGKPLPGTEVKILNPDENGEGEVLTKGPHIFSGYWGDSAATAEALDANKFLHTGDKGRLDAQGNLFITGRLKEIIKTSGGENIPLLRVEEKIKAELPIVSQAVVIGNKRNYLICLLTLKTETDCMGNPTEQLAPEVISVLRGINSSATTLKEAAEDQKVQQFLMQGIQRANQHADSRAQRIQKIKVLPEDFSVMNELITPTQKLKRSAIEKRYEKEISALYATTG